MTINCFSAPPLVGALVLKTFPPLDDSDCWIALTGLGMSTAVGSVMVLLLSGLGASRPVAIPRDTQ